MNKIITYLLLALFFFSVTGCSNTTKDIPANAAYGKGESIKVMKFYADWCPPCKAMEPEYKKVKNIYQYIEFEEIDFEHNKEKIDEYKVQGIPMIVISKNGQETSRRSGYMSRNDLVKFIEENK